MFNFHLIQFKGKNEQYDLSTSLESLLESSEVVHVDVETSIFVVVLGQSKVYYEENVLIQMHRNKLSGHYIVCAEDASESFHSFSIALTSMPVDELQNSNSNLRIYFSL